MEWRERDGVRWLEAELPQARAAFSTRLGGVSEPPYDSLNVGLLTGDDRATVSENRSLLADALGVAAGYVLSALQVHGVNVERREAAPEPNGFETPGTPLIEADGQVTSTKGLAPLVMVADCLPIALSGGGGVAMLHCGWRGLAEGIVERGVREVGATAAAVGPGIGPCCYEVGGEVLSAFTDLGGGVADGRMLDLAAVATALLERAGVSAVEVAEECTSCNPDLFFSHRRDGECSGRQAGLIRIESTN